MNRQLIETWHGGKGLTSISLESFIGRITANGMKIIQVIPTRYLVGSDYRILNEAIVIYSVN